MTHQTQGGESNAGSTPVHYRRHRTNAKAIQHPAPAGERREFCCWFSVGRQSTVDNRTNAKVTPIQHPAPAVSIMSGHCRKDVQPPNQDMVNRRAFCPAYTTRQKRRRGQCWASVCSAGQTPTQQMARVLCMPCQQYIIYYCNAEYYACKILLLHNSNIIGFSCVCLSGLESQDQAF